MLVSPISAGQKVKDRVAIIKVSYKGFEADQQRLINHTIDTTFAKEAKKRFKAAEATREDLMGLGILADNLCDPRQYLLARDTLRIRHAIVIDFEQLGTYAHGLVRLFSVDPPGTFEYPIGTTLDSLNYEIQQAAREILRLIPPKPKKRWRYILAGVGGASLITTLYLILHSGLDDLPEPTTPPKVSGMP